MAVTGKFEVTKNDDVYYFSLYASNGQLLYDSRPYASEKSCKAAIETFKKNISEAPLDVRRDKTNNFRWIYVNGPVYFMGISYTTAKSAESNAASVKRFAESAPVVTKID